MQHFDLSGRVAVVTGGNRGIGLGFARGIVRAGGAVAVWSRSQEANEAAVAELAGLGGEAVAVACDVTDEASVDAALRTTLERLGPIDALFANAGTTGEVRFPDLAFDEWRRVLSVNLDGTFLAVRAVVERMIERGSGGSIVVTASVAGTHGLPRAPHYSASKGGQLGFVRALAAALARYGIRVNAVSPGFVETEMTGELAANERFQQALMARVPMRRWGRPADFEAVAVFLASETASGFVTGTEIVVDGGYSAF